MRRVVKPCRAKMVEDPPRDCELPSWRVLGLMLQSSQFQHLLLNAIGPPPAQPLPHFHLAPHFPSYMQERWQYSPQEVVYPKRDSICQ
jgi:hypothetical protein